VNEREAVVHLRRTAARVAVLAAAVALVALGPLIFVSNVGADSSIAGYNAGGLAIGAQFAFNVPGVVPLPGENLIEDDVPFARTNIGQGPVVDSIGAPYYPGDIAANLGSLLAEFGAPPSAGGLNDSNLAHTQFPNSPSAPSQASFGVSPSTGTPANPSIFYSSSHATASGGDATGVLSDFALDNVGAAPAASSLLPSSSPTGATQSLVDVGNVSATDKVSLSGSSITSTATSQVNGIQIAGLVDVAGLTSTANATSDGTTGTPTASLHMGQVTVDGESAYIDDTGVHVTSTNAPAAVVTPAQLQQTVDSTLSQDGISIRLIDPKLTNQGAQASADAGGLAVSISHQLDVPFIPGEPTLPVPQLGNIGLPAGLYTVTTSMTFGLAQANVQANVAPATANTGNTGAAPAASTSSSSTTGNSGSGGFETFGNTGNTGSGTFSTTSLQPTGPGSSASASLPAQSLQAPSSATDFPIRGIPAPLGWVVVLLALSLIGAYPFLLLARWQFTPGRRR
jgi:hypothetical protein